jgi:hypothetical protein
MLYVESYPNNWCSPMPELVRPQNLEASPELSALLAEVAQIPVTEQTYQTIVTVAQGAKARIKHLTDEKEKITKPLNEALKAARAWFAEPIKAYEQVEQICKGKIAEHQRAQLQLKQALIVQFAASPQDVSAPQTLAVLAAAPAPQGVSVRELWCVEVTDPTQVPRHFLDVSEQRLLAHARAYDGAAVPGVRFFKRSSVAVRGV